MQGSVKLEAVPWSHDSQVTTSCSRRRTSQIPSRSQSAEWFVNQCFHLKKTCSELEWCEREKALKESLLETRQSSSSRSKYSRSDYFSWLSRPLLQTSAAPTQRWDDGIGWRFNLCLSCVLTGDQLDFFMFFSFFTWPYLLHSWTLSFSSTQIKVNTDRFQLHLTLRRWKQTREKEGKRDVYEPRMSVKSASEVRIYLRSLKWSSNQWYSAVFVSKHAPTLCPWRLWR